MTSMMADVVNRGTASTARTAGFRHAAAGKTGTSQSYADAWFVGYTPALVTGVWIGFDKPQTIMKRGYAGVVAVPVWARFMSAALKGTKSPSFEMPGSVTKVKLCRLSGGLATERCHLPVIDPPASNAGYPWALTPVVREGGVYDEVRHVHREPQPCPLWHTDAFVDHGPPPRWLWRQGPLPHPADALDPGGEEFPSREAGLTAAINNSASRPADDPSAQTHPSAIPSAAARCTQRKDRCRDGG
jgi:membrane peptidoglycan carboxypeptidase